MNKTIIKYLLVGCLFFLSSLAQAQSAPEISFSVKSHETGAYPEWTILSAGATWNFSEGLINGGLGITAEASMSGSANLSSFQANFSCNLSRSERLWGRGLFEPKLLFGGAIKTGATVRVNVVSSGQATVSDWTTEAGRGGGVAFSSTCPNCPILLGSVSVPVPYGVLPPGPYSYADSKTVSYLSVGSCAAPTEFRGIFDGSAGLFCDLGSYAYGSFSGSVSAVYSIDYVGTVPTAEVSEPLVAGEPNDNPPINSTVTFNNQSFDTDDILNGSPTPLAFICSALWTLTKPDGSTETSSALPSFSTVANQEGNYTLSLTVRDNEGSQATTSKSFFVGQERPDPPDSDISSGWCADGSASISTGAVSGISRVGSHDPAKTRGYHLKNDIFVPSLRDRTFESLGNAFFSYGTRLVFVRQSEYLYDGRGRKHIYTTVVSSDSSTPGTYAKLTHVSANGGYRLSGAGPLEAIHKAGNFEYLFNSSGFLTKIKDPSGNEQTISYASTGKPSLVTDNSSGKKIEFQYDSENRISKMIENGGFAVREISYESASGENRVISIVTKDASNNTVRRLDFTYDSLSRVTSATRDSDSATTATFTYQTDSAGRSYANVNYAQGATNYDYLATPSSGAKYKTTKTNFKGGVVSYEFDQVGNVRTVTEPAYEGASTPVTRSFTYDNNRNVLTASDGITTTTNTYNSFGLPTRSEDNLGRFKTYTYDGVNLTSVADNVGTLLTLEYSNNAVTGITNGVGEKVTIDRNSYGQATAIHPPAGSPSGSLTFVYEENTQSPNYGLLKSITNGAGDLVTYDNYTPLGDVTSISTYPAAGVVRTTQYNYDATQRLKSVTNPDGKISSIGYTGANATSSTDEAGRNDQFSYCAECGKLTGTSGPLAHALNWVLDADKDTTTFKDARNKETNYQYGLSRELKGITYPDTTTESFSYDSAARLTSTNDSAARQRIFTYDTGGWVTRDETSDAAFDYTYNPDGTVASVTRTDINYSKTYEHDAARRLSRERVNFGNLSSAGEQVVEYVYNPDSTLAIRRWLNGTTLVGQWQYTYDAAGREVSVTNNFGDTATFEYDGEGKVLSQVNSNKTSIEYEYHPQRAWLTRISFFLKNARNVAIKKREFLLEYDGGANTVGNLTKVTELNGAVTPYVYDALYRLVSEARTVKAPYARDYTYDLAGNILTKDGAAFGIYDAANKATKIKNKVATHDLSGNFTSLVGSYLPLNTLTWTKRNELASVSRTTTGNRQYTYDENGWRIKAGGSLGDTTVYLFSGGNLLGEITSGVPSVAYTWGEAGLLSKRDLTGTPASFFYEFGPQGEVRALTNVLGKVTDRYRYSGYGEKLGGSGTNSNPFRYGGKFGYYTDDESGFILATHRWYAPKLMRWLSRDPIGYEGGVNLYEYVSSDPVGYVDPDGLCPWCVAAGVGAAVGAGLDLAFQLYDNGGDFGAVEWGDVGEQAVVGAAFGGCGGAIGGLLSKVAKASSKVLLNTPRQLQAKFKHAGNFGVVGNYSKANAGKFSSAINKHINSAGVQAIKGTYRGQSVIHYLNSNTGLNVISSPSGQFISGWKLNTAQLQNILKHGGL